MERARGSQMTFGDDIEEEESERGSQMTFEEDIEEEQGEEVKGHLKRI